MNCFIEFQILNHNKFKDLKATFGLIKQAKNNQEPKDDQFWLDSFPGYALKKFYFLDNDVRPTFKTSEPTDNIWHFYSLIELMQTNYEITYIDLYQLSLNKARLEFNPYSYPYGGPEGLLTFIRSFDCVHTLVDDGTETYVPNFPDASLESNIPKTSAKSEKKFNFWNIFNRSK